MPGPELSRNPAIMPARMTRAGLLGAAVVAAAAAVLGPGTSAYASNPCLGNNPPPDCPSGPPPPDVNNAQFDWSLDRLHTDQSGATVSRDYDWTNEKPTSTVLFDACASTVAGTRTMPHGGRISGFRWTFSTGETRNASSCQLAWERPLSTVDQAVSVSVTVIPASGAPFSSAPQAVHYRDVVVASLGDSAASGQGAPDTYNGSAGFSNSGRCYRSGNAASALAAGRLQRQLGTGVTVHFWFLACSGATITAQDMQTWASGPGALDPTPITDWGGLLSPYRGPLVSQKHGPLIKPQVARLGELIGQTTDPTVPSPGLHVDALLLTAGANDLGWGPDAEKCLPLGLIPELFKTQRKCLDGFEPVVAQSRAALPSHFRMLADALADRSTYYNNDTGTWQTWLPTAIPPSKVFLTDYFDPIDSLRPQPGDCAGEPVAGLYLRQYAVARVENPLQQTVAAAATANHWNYLSGWRQLSQGHGTCVGVWPFDSTDRWVNSSHDTIDTPGEDINSTWHAKTISQNKMADLITPTLERTVATTPSAGDGFASNETWTEIGFLGDQGQYFADVTGDGKADAIVSNGNGITVRRSTGSGFAPNETWTNNGFVGDHGQYFADVTGDGKADAIVSNGNGITVRRSTGSGFAPNETWTNNGFVGDHGQYFADVTGDGKADAIVSNGNGITVRRSTGNGFAPNETWTNNGFVGDHGQYFADVTGDGKADAIVSNWDGITVRRSTGSGFAPNETWTNNGFVGDHGQYFADVTGDGKADAIVSNWDGITVRRSTGSGFAPNETWTNNGFVGDHGQYFADVTGDGKADAIVSNWDAITVRRSTG